MKQIFASFFAVLFGAFLAQAADDHITYEGKEGPGKGKHIVLLSPGAALPRACFSRWG